MLDVVYKRDNNDDYNRGDINKNVGHETNFCNTFNRKVVKHRNNDFIHILADQVTERYMIEDTHLSVGKI